MDRVNIGASIIQSDSIERNRSNTTATTPGILPIVFKFSITAIIAKAQAKVNMILPIYVYGQPVLRKVAQDITPDYPELKELIQNMFETNTASDGVGLAAPQIGKSIRVVVVDLDVLSDTFPEYKDYRHAFINGHILEYDDSETETLEEGCLSLPGVHESVTRAKRVYVKWYDENLVEHEEWIDGYLARVIQHEFDHLEGRVFTDRLSAFRKQMITSKLKALLQGKVRCHYRVKAPRK